MEKKNIQLDYVDAMRGMAILAVIMVHSRLNIVSGWNDYIKNVVDSGMFGVQLFFVVSAFTLFLSFSKRKKEERFPIRNFFIRRYFRLAPIYYIGILYFLYLNGRSWNYWLGDDHSVIISDWNIFSNFLFLHGFNPYWINSLVPGGWSLAIEVIFYLILPFVFSRIKDLNSAIIFFAISILLRTSFYYFFENEPFVEDKRLWADYLSLYFFSQLPVFALGIILYFVTLENKILYDVEFGKALLLPAVIMLLQLATGITDLFFSKDILFGIAFFILGIGLSKFKFRLIVNKIINYIGKISYSMYIVHFAVLYWIKSNNWINYFDNILIDFCFRYILVVIVTILISSLLYQFIEVPFQSIGKNLIAKLEKKNQV